jgi:hypothetical protein
MSPQGDEGIRVSPFATPGGTVIVNVGPNDDVVEISVSGSGESLTYHVPGNKDTAIPVPPVAPGSTLIVRVGKGARRRRAVVVIVAPGP